MCKLEVDELRWLRWLREPFPRPPAAVYTGIMMMMGPGSGFMFGPLIPILLLAGALYVGWKLYNHRAWSGRTERTSENDGRQNRDGSRSAPQIEAPTAADLYRLAQRHAGKLTVSNVVVELGVDPTVAEQSLQACSDEIRVRMDVQDDGRVIYHFLELEDSGR